MEYMIDLPFMKNDYLISIIIVLVAFTIWQHIRLRDWQAYANICTTLIKSK